MGSRPRYAHREIAGTTIFDGVQAQKGYALNKMCYSFNSAENRAAFVADEFDITTCQEMVVDHAFTLPLKLMWPGEEACPISNTASGIMVLANAA